MSSSGSTAALSPLNSLALGSRASRPTDAASASGTAAASAPAGAAPDRTQAFSALATAILAALPSAPSGTAAPSVDPTGVANAIAAALGPTGQGGGGVSALIKSLDGAVVAASTVLKKAGASTDSIDNFAADFLRQVSQQLDVIAAQAAGPSGAVTSASATSTASTAGTAASGSLDVSERGLIQLQTQNGSVVTIRVRYRTSYGLTGASASGPTGVAAYAQVAAFNSSRFSVSVQGSLSAEDLQAINDVLGQVDTLASQFFSGNLAQAFATGSSLSIDPSEIASLKVSLTETESLSLASLGAGPSPTSDASGSAGPAAATPTSSAAPAASPAGDSSTPAGAGSTVPAAPSSATAGAAASSASLDALFAYLKAVIAALGTSTVSGSVTISSSTKIALLAGAIGGAPRGRGSVDRLLNQLGAATS